MHGVRLRPGARAMPYLIASDGERRDMSIQGVSWALKRRTGSATDKAVLLVVSEAASVDTGSCYLSHQTIAERAELSPRAVWSSLKRLEGRFICRTRRADSRGHRTSDLITLLMDQAAPGASGADVQAAPSAGRQVALLAPEDSPNPHLVQTLVAPGAEEPPPEPVNEPRESARPHSQNDSKEVPISPTWEPPEDADDFGASIGLTNTEVGVETAKFKVWHVARKRTSLSADWAATWRLWMLRASERKAERSKGGDTVGAKPAAVDGKRWSGPDEILELVAVAGVTEWYLAAYFNWQELPDRALVTKSATAFDKVRSRERALREAGWKLLLRQERAA